MMIEFIILREIEKSLLELNYLKTYGKAIPREQPNQIKN